MAGDSAAETPSTARKVIVRAATVALVGVSLYVVGPSLVEVLSSWEGLTSIAPGWFVVVFGLQALSFVAMWWLLVVLFKTDDWFGVATSHLAGFAVSKVVPAGGPAGAAVQFRLLRNLGIDPGAALSGLTAFSLLQTASVFGLPLLALPFVLTGAPVPSGLLQTAVLGAAAFVFMGAMGAWVLFRDDPLILIGRGVQAVRNRFRKPPIDTIPVTLLYERDRIREALGREWPKATLAVVGRVGLDYLSLLAALRAVGAEPRASLVLLAYAAQGILSTIPLTPGGVGFVEAGLTGTLTLAGVRPADAVLAVLFYRLASYWLPMGLGALSYGLFRWRRGGPIDDNGEEPATDG